MLMYFKRMLYMSIHRRMKWWGGLTNCNDVLLDLQSAILCSACTVLFFKCQWLRNLSILYQHILS